MCLPGRVPPMIYGSLLAPMAPKASLLHPVESHSPLESRFKTCCTTEINGHFRNLNWRYLPYIRPIFQAYVREYPHKIWPYRILNFPLNVYLEVSQVMGVPPVIIHFRLGFSMKYTFEKNTIYGNLHFEYEFVLTICTIVPHSTTFDSYPFWTLQSVAFICFVLGLHVASRIRTSFQWRCSPPNRIVIISYRMGPPR